MRVQMATERVEPARPELAIGLEPGLELEQRRRVQPIDTALGADAGSDQARITQHLEMLRHARLAELETLDQTGNLKLLQG